MSPSTTGTIFLITGASRGIGLAIVRELAKRSTDANPNIIIAAVRNPSSVPLIDEVRKDFPKVTIDVVAYAAADVEKNKMLAEYVKEKYGRVDVVVPNAGIGNYMGPVVDTPLNEMREHWEVNALGPLVLFQALVPLLKASSDAKFIPITSGAGSSAYFDANIGQAAYGSSKAVLNFVAKKIHVEEDWITSFPLAPGIIMTDMAYQARDKDTTGALAQMQDQLGLSIEEGGRLLVDIITQSTRKTHGGEYFNVDGTKLPW